ncbi:MAG: DUF58 domain-containing protein [Waddliaceae bacterium]|nr:DUF58 domain-containing protein [Waddliaceae bacterium]
MSADIFKKIRQIQIRTSHTVSDLLAGAYHSAFKGRGMEFEEVRPYQPGDEVRSIDWNVTARMNTPYVKNYREERELTVMLLVDISASSQFGRSDASKKQFIAELGAILAFSATQNNDKVGLILFSDRVEKYIPPNRGLRHVLRVIRELLVSKAEYSGTNIEVALKYLAKVQKRKGVCFLISDFIAQACPKETRIISKRHDLISVCITDPYEIELPNIGLINVQDLESGSEYLIDSSDPNVREAYRQETEKRIQRQKKLMTACKSGFIDIRTDQEYVTAIRDYFKLKEKRR